MIERVSIARAALLERAIQDHALSPQQLNVITIFCRALRGGHPAIPVDWVRVGTRLVSSNFTADLAELEARGYLRRSRCLGEDMLALPEDLLEHTTAIRTHD